MPGTIATQLPSHPRTRGSCSSIRPSKQHRHPSSLLCPGPARLQAYNSTARQNNYEDVFTFKKANATLYQGWNTIAFTMYDEDVGTDRVISVNKTGTNSNAGLNYFGYSSSTPINVSDINFTNSSGWTANWSTAVSQGKAQAYFLYYDGTNKYAATPDLEMDDTALRTYEGYSVVVNENGSLVFPGVGGTSEGQTYAFDNLRFSNGSLELNVSEANNATYNWIFMTNDEYIYYKEGQFFKTVCGSTFFCDSTTLSPWNRTYWIWINQHNVQIIRKN